MDVLSKLKNNFMQPLMNQMKPEDHNTVFFKIKVNIFVGLKERLKYIV